MARTATKKKPTLFHAKLHVTRVEHWSVEADSEEQARELLSVGEGHRTHVGDRVHVELLDIEE